MGYYPGPGDSFFGHVPHFLLWLCVVFLSAACGGGIANAADLRPSRQWGCVLLGSMGGMVVASLLFLGR
jgi:hypothetical protein